MLTASFWEMSALLVDRAVPAPLIPIRFAFLRAGSEADHRTVIGTSYTQLRYRRF